MFKGMEKERERNIDHLTPTCLQLEIEPETQACAVTGNRTGDLLLHQMVLNQELHQPGLKVPFLLQTSRLQLTGTMLISLM